MSELVDAERAHLGLVLRLKKALASGAENVCFSPFSIASALGAVGQLAQGATETELIRLLLNVNPDNSKTSSHSAFADQLAHLRAASVLTSSGQAEQPVLSLSNTLWLWDELPLAERFPETVSNWPSGSIATAPFVDDPEGARLRINADVSATTKGLIPEFIPSGAIAKNTVAAVINALYLKTSWQSPFPADSTGFADFHAPSGLRSVATMRQEHRVGYCSSDGWQLIDLPARGGLHAIILLPEGDLEQQESTVDVELLISLISSARITNLNVSFPKLNLDIRSDLSGALQNLGVRTMFGPQADFTKLTEDPRIQISDVLHQAVLRVDEEGFEGAAATGALIAMTAYQPPIEIKVNRPFLFFVRHRETGVLYFFARVVEP